MNQIKTLKELKALSGRTFKRVVDASVPCVENIDAMREQLRASLKAQGYDFSDWEENERSFTFGSQFVQKPKLLRESVGTINFRSKDYTFTVDGAISYGGQLKKEHLTENGFKFHHLTYTLTK